jgi:hypothetical protein
MRRQGPARRGAGIRAATADISPFVRKKFSVNLKKSQSRPRYEKNYLEKIERFFIRSIFAALEREQRGGIRGKFPLDARQSRIYRSCTSLPFRKGRCRPASTAFYS